MFTKDVQARSTAFRFSYVIFWVGSSFSAQETLTMDEYRESITDFDVIKAINDGIEELRARRWVLQARALSGKEW